MHKPEKTSNRGGARPGAGRKPGKSSSPAGKVQGRAVVRLPAVRKGGPISLDVDFDGDRRTSAALAFAVIHSLVKSDDVPPDLRLRAAVAILDRVEGKPRQMVRISTDDGDPDETDYDYHGRPNVQGEWNEPEPGSPPPRQSSASDLNSNPDPTSNLNSVAEDASEDDRAAETTARGNAHDD